MASGSSSTSPIEKFRWKLELSSIASQRQNSTYGNTSSVFFMSVSFFQAQPDQQAVFTLRNQQRLRGRNAVLLPLDHAVAETVAAGIAVQLRFRGLPAGIPDSLAVFDINMKPLLVDRAVIIAVAGQTAQPRVAIEAVAACRVGQEREKNPRCRDS